MAAQNAATRFFGCFEETGLITKRLMAFACALALLSGCGSVGRYRGAEPFGGKDYVVAPPAARLAQPAKVVLLVFKDERPANAHDLEWTRQASNYENTLGHVKEVRGEFARAIRAGLAAHRKIELVSSEEFLQTHDADLVISGRILRCDADRKMAWSNSYFIAQSTIEVVLRDGRGKLLQPHPLRYSASAQKVIVFPSDNTMLDNVPVGLVAAAVEESIRQTAEAFLGSREMSEALAPR